MDFQVRDLLKETAVLLLLPTLSYLTTCFGLSFAGWIRVCYSNLPPEKCKVAASRLADGIRDLCS